MGDVDEVQEQMKADMMALKDQMASMMEAMLSKKILIESNTARTAIASAPSRQTLLIYLPQIKRINLPWTWGNEEERYWGAPVTRV